MRLSGYSESLRSVLLVTGRSHWGKRRPQRPHFPISGSRTLAPVELTPHDRGFLLACRRGAGVVSAPSFHELTRRLSLTRLRSYPGERLAIGTIIVTDEKARNSVPRKGFGNWRASHSAVGLVVTPIHRRRRRPSPKITNTNSRSNASVGTIRKSTDAIPSAWLRRKVFHP